MKWLIASDIHGSAYYCEKLIEAYKREAADRILLLGDVLYHGPRNDLPKDYAPKQVIAMLNPLANDILCVRGNCEAEVDQMVLAFPVMAEYAVLFMDGITFYGIHGHKNMDLPVMPGDVVLSGHTHIPDLREENGVFYCNPGSVSIPKDGSVRGYLIYENGVMTHKKLEEGSSLMPLHILKTI